MAGNGLRHEDNGHQVQTGMAQPPAHPASALDKLSPTRPLFTPAEKAELLGRMSQTGPRRNEEPLP